MKLLIGTVIAVAFGALVLGFWIAPGWMKGVMSHFFWMAVRSGSTRHRPPEDAGDAGPGTSTERIAQP